MGLLLTLLVQGLMIFLLLTLAPTLTGEKDGAMIMVDIAAPPVANPEPDKPATPEQPAQQARPRPPAPRETAPIEVPPPTPVETVLVPVPSEVMAATDIAALPTRPRPAGPLMGPPAPTGSDDTPRVEGTGPNGEPLYAARWLREPYDDELKGYLSTARGPGWGLIACRTAKGFRVEDCISLGESPGNSGIANAVLAAAWQFRVRPPQKGGVDMVGEWVRIRIDYGLRRE